ncbi:MAG: CsgG/HfaB family protein [Bacteroidales bacterium]|nr:CsgG/HfaB family protein [Candidatus Latescibacterota bacterium]
MKKYLMTLAPILMIFVLVGCRPASKVKAANTDIQKLEVPQTTDPLESGFISLVDQIVEGLKTQQASQIAVVQFQNLDGTVTEFGGFLAEEMITRLYKTGSFRVVEREMLNRVMAEHELATSGLVDESTAKELGRLLGVDAIATGTITDLGQRVRINSRLIATETGSVFSVAAVTLPKDSSIEILMGKILISDGSKKVHMQKVVNTENSSMQDDNIFFYEDFSKIEEGMLPNGWIGGVKMAVLQSKIKKDGNCLTNFKKGPYSFAIPSIDFPENWMFKFIVSYGNSNNFNFKIGNEIEVVFHESYGSIFFNGMNIRSKPPKQYQEFMFCVEKIGDVIKLYVNGNKIYVIRINNLERPRAITFSVGQTFEIYKLEGIRID